MQPWTYTLGSDSSPASLGTSLYALVTYTFDGRSRPISELPSRMGEDGPAEVGGVPTLLEVELSAVPGASAWKSDGNEAAESFFFAWSGRT